VGGGLAGLGTGVYAQRCGFETTVFEAHSRPGGVCASWSRGPYLMDAGVRMVIGTSPPNPFHEILCEVGVMHSVPFERIRVFHCIEDESGERLHIRKDPGEFRDELLAAAPLDRDRVERFIGILRDFSRFRPDLQVERDSGLRDGIRAASRLGPVIDHLARYWKVPLTRWLAGFESRRIRNAFSCIYNIRDFPVLAMFTSLGWLTGGQIGKPLAGAQSISDAVAGTFRGLGGEIRLSARVKEIMVTSGRASGVRLEDGSEHRAGTVIGAADGRSTIFDLLGGRFVDDALAGRYRDLPVFPPLVTVHLGVAMDPASDPETIVWPLGRPVKVPGGVLRRINLHRQGGGLNAPSGHSVMRVGCDTSYEEWADLARDPGAYRREKDRIADEIVERLDERYPGLAGSVRVRDVSTPITYERITANWKGAYEGWLPSIHTFGLRIPRTLPGLDGFYMVGQWVEPGGGVPAVLLSARNAVRRLCRDLGRPFTPWG